MSHLDLSNAYDMASKSELEDIFLYMKNMNNIEAA